MGGPWVATRMVSKLGFDCVIIDNGRGAVEAFPRQLPQVCAGARAAPPTLPRHNRGGADKKNPIDFIGAV